MEDKYPINYASEGFYRRGKHHPPAPRGLPRPFLAYKGFPVRATDPKDGAKLPSPWIAHAAAKEQMWAMWDEHSKTLCQASDMMLCQVCGEWMDGLKFYGVLGNINRYRTSGPGMHLKCGMIACKFCPHLVREHSLGHAVGFIYDGPDNGIGEWQDDLELSVTNEATIVNLVQLKDAVKEERKTA